MSDFGSINIPSARELEILGNQLMADDAGFGTPFVGAKTLPLTAEPDAGQNAYAPVVESQSEADIRNMRGADAPKISTKKGSDASEDERNKSIIIGSKSLYDIRKDFPILETLICGHRLIWMDNGATTQRPKQVIDRLSYYYEHENSNVHRGVHELADISTDAYEGARQITADFLGAEDKDNIVFVRGTTEGINLVAQAYVKQFLSPGDEIIVSLLEHHANIVPWQLVAQETGAVLKVIPIDESGQLDLAAYAALFSERTKFVAVTHVSNTLGTITPVCALTQTAHAHGVRILIDGAQSVAHIPVNVQAIDADFYVFSGHKIFAPNGIGAVYGKADVWEVAKPYHGGGNMIKDVTFERTIYNEAPNKFEAGTGSIGDAVAMGEALKYVSDIGIADIGRYEHELTKYAMSLLEEIPGLTLYGHALERSGVLSFTLEGHSIFEVGERLNDVGIAVRAGHHCAQPVLRSLGLEGTVRPVLAFYNTPGEVEKLAQAIRNIG